MKTIEVLGCTLYQVQLADETTVTIDFMGVIFAAEHGMLHASELNEDGTAKFPAQ